MLSERVLEMQVEDLLTDLWRVFYYQVRRNWERNWEAGELPAYDDKFDFPAFDEVAEVLACYILCSDVWRLPRPKGARNVSQFIRLFLVEKLVTWKERNVMAEVAPYLPVLRRIWEDVVVCQDIDCLKPVLKRKAFRVASGKIRCAYCCGRIVY